MTIFQYIGQRVRLAILRRRLRDINRFIIDLEDQVHSGRVALRNQNRNRLRVEADIFSLESPDEIVRRAPA